MVNNICINKEYRLFLCYILNHNLNIDKPFYFQNKSASMHHFRQVSRYTFSRHILPLLTAVILNNRMVCLYTLHGTPNF